MEIIPAIDCIDGKCVRLVQGDYAKKTVYQDNPLDVAREFEDAGIRRLHLVDLDGAKSGRVVNWEVLEKISSGTSLEIDFGGGIKTEEDLQKVWGSGAKWATIGSLAVKQPEIFRQWIIRYGASSFFLGADVRGEKISVNGWQETTSLDVHNFISQYISSGLDYIFCTDISKDGKLEGPSTALYQRIMEHNPRLRLVASGGVSTLADLYALKNAGCSGVIIGKAIYENRISLEELKIFLA